MARTFQLLPLRCLTLTALAIGLVTAMSLPALAAQTVTLGGVGSLTPVIKRLAEDFKKRNPGIDVVVINPPLGSSGGVRALAAGKVDIALSGRELKQGEAGTAKVWVETPLVLATNGGKNKGLTVQEIADIYAARKTSWSDGAGVRLVLRGEHESETAALRSMSPEMDVAVAAASPWRVCLDSATLNIRVRGVPWWHVPPVDKRVELTGTVTKA